MEYKHKSGAQKRKEKADKFERAKIGSRTLFEFGISKEKSEHDITPTSVESNELNIHDEHNRMDETEDMVVS